MIPLLKVRCFSQPTQFPAYFFPNFQHPHFSFLSCLSFSLFTQVLTCTLTFSDLYYPTISLKIPFFLAYFSRTHLVNLWYQSVWTIWLGISPPTLPSRPPQLSQIFSRWQDLHLKSCFSAISSAVKAFKCWVSTRDEDLCLDVSRKDPERDALIRRKISPVSHLAACAKSRWAERSW